MTDQLFQRYAPACGSPMCASTRLQNLRRIAGVSELSGEREPAAEILSGVVDAKDLYPFHL